MTSKSRREYFNDLQTFLSHMAATGIHPYAVTGDDVRLYKEALVQAGQRPASIARALSVIRGTYEQFGKKGLVPWNEVGDIQAVESPRVEKNTTPSLTEADAIKLLHAPDTSTTMGARDHALLFTYFKTACRASAIANATIGDLERSDMEWKLAVREKGGRERKLLLLEAGPAIMAWLERSTLPLHNNAHHPLFPAFEPNKRTVTARHLTTRAILKIVKKYAQQIGLNASPAGRRGICTHTLRKTAANDALQHGAALHEVQQWLGHADIQTTQGYATYKEDDAEAAARRSQIR